MKPDDRLGSDRPSAVFALTRNSYSPFGFKFDTGKAKDSYVTKILNKLVTKLDTGEQKIE